MARISSRLKRLETSQGAFFDVTELISQGAHYDEISPIQRQRYAAYKGVTTQAIETVENAVNGTLHFPLERNKTADSIAETTSKIEKAIFL